jgi:thiol-disulfide isomerase/thioredoxin
LKKRFVTLSLGFICAIGLTALGQETRLTTNSLMPEVRMQTLTGENVQLSSLRGKPVVLNFWASWCGPCRDEIPVLERLQTKYQGITIIGANVGETKRTIDRFLSSTPIAYTVWMDQPEGGTNLQQVLSGWQGEKNGFGIPFTVIIRKDGVVDETIFGFDGTGRELEQSIREVLQ